MQACINQSWYLLSIDVLDVKSSSCFFTFLMASVCFGRTITLHIEPYSSSLLSHQLLQTLCISWQLTLQPQLPSPLKGRTENCKTSLRQRGWKWRKKGRTKQRLPTATTAPRTEREKEGSASRSATSSPPAPNGSHLHPDPCSPVRIEPHIWPGVIILLQGAKKRRTTECANSSRPLLHVFPTTKRDAKTKRPNLKMELRELLTTVNAQCLRPRWREEAQKGKKIWKSTLKEKKRLFLFFSFFLLATMSPKTHPKKTRSLILVALQTSA